MLQVKSLFSCCRDRCFSLSPILSSSSSDFPPPLCVRAISSAIQVQQLTTSESSVACIVQFKYVTLIMRGGGLCLSVGVLQARPADRATPEILCIESHPSIRMKVKNQWKLFLALILKITNEFFILFIFIYSIISLIVVSVVYHYFTLIRLPLHWNVHPVFGDSMMWWRDDEVAGGVLGLKWDPFYGSV